MKKSILMALAIVAILLTVPRDAFATRENHTFTLNPGTPIQISTQQIFVKRIIIQMGIQPSGGAQFGCIMAGIRSGYTPSCSNSSDLTAQLAPASTTAPGGSYSDPNGAPGGISVPDIDLSSVWIDGGHADPVIVSWEF